MALVLASRHSSVDGVLHTATAFAALGDREVVEQCLRVATTLAHAKRDLGGHHQVQAFRESWSRHRGAEGDSDLRPTGFLGEPLRH